MTRTFTIVIHGILLRCLLIRKDFGKNAVKSVIILAGKNQGFETENLVAKADAI